MNGEWSKEIEATYYRKIPEQSLNESFLKPFSERERGRLIAEIGILMSLLPEPPGRLLDLGSGTGWTSRFFAHAGYEVVGTDFAPEAVELAVQKNSQENLTFLQHDWDQRLPEHAGTFDIAVFFDSLHHSADEKLPLRTAYDALNPDGVCITCEPGTGHALSPSSVHAMTTFGVNERDMPPRQIVSAARAVGFRTAKIYPHPNEIIRNLYADRETGSFRDRLLAARIGEIFRVVRAISAQKNHWGIVVLRK